VLSDGLETDSPLLAEVFDLDAPAGEIADVLGRDPGLRFTPGVRVPGVVDGYELAIRAVLGQQISVAAARTHAARLVVAAGEAVAEQRGTVTHVFPTAAAIAGAPDSAFAMPARRRETLRSLAGAPLDDLVSLPGIGPWTQSYVAMRALRDRDAWLGTDLGVRHALTRIGHDGDAGAWRPFRAYAVVHLWSLL
jgi:AraC family transcriptional regulator of adaptative response / DNA-3-methyladenine glycosylase II